jgi:hypothetical protein
MKTTTKSAFPLLVSKASTYSLSKTDAIKGRSDGRAANNSYAQLQELINLSPRQTAQRLKRSQLAVKTKTKPQDCIQRKYILSQDLVEAKNRLQSSYSNLEITSIKGDSEFTDEFWENHIGNKLLDEYIAHQLGHTPAGNSSNNYIRVIMNPDKRSLGINIIIYKPNITSLNCYKPDTTLFSVNYHYAEKSDSAVDVKIESIFAKGTAGAFISNALLKSPIQSSIDEISLTAASASGKPDGVFAWARYGFIPTEDDWKEMVSRGSNSIKGHKKKEWYSDVKASLQNPSPTALKNIVYLSWKHKDDESLKEILNGMIGSQWNGTIDLTNVRNKQWIQEYATNGSRFPDRYTNLINQNAIADNSNSNCNCVIQ